MNKTIVSIIGMGNLGSKLASLISKSAEVYAFDINPIISNKFNDNEAVKFVDTIEKTFHSNMIILALPRDGIVDFFINNYSKISKHTICVNMCSFIQLQDILNLLSTINLELNNNIYSCKLIGHFENISKNSCMIISDYNCHDNKNLDLYNSLMSNIGNIKYENEDKYMNLNLFLAESAMETVLKLSTDLHKKGYCDDIICAAIQGVFSGTAKQYPYTEINTDYFLNKLCDEKPYIKTLLNKNKIERNNAYV